MQEEVRRRATRDRPLPPPRLPPPLLLRRQEEAETRRCAQSAECDRWAKGDARSVTPAPSKAVPCTHYAPCGTTRIVSFFSDEGHPSPAVGMTAHVRVLVSRRDVGQARGPRPSGPAHERETHLVLRRVAQRLQVPVVEEGEGARVTHVEGDEARRPDSLRRRPAVIRRLFRPALAET